MRRLFWPLVLVGLALAALDVIDARYVLAPLLGLLIWRVGVASFGSLRAGAAYVPEGDPVPVDPRTERTTYWCAGCGAELLLLVRGAQTPPRHCGERMTERTELARSALD
jgi:DNA-directed RNA polymerase subunit RPC12/RpoP